MVGMKHGSNPRRGRSRGGNGGKRHQSSRNQAFDSNGPDGKVRGSAQQIYDKYLSLARDATSAGEHIAAEGFYQFAEHYYRLANVDGANNQAENRSQQGNQNPDNQQQDGQPEGAAQPEADNQSGDKVAVDGNGSDERPRRQRSPRKASADVTARDDIGNTQENPSEINTVDESGAADAENADDDDLAASA